MVSLRSIPLIALGVFFLYPCTIATAASPPSLTQTKYRYSRAHSLGDKYYFDPRDGWHAVNVTNLSYKYRHRNPINSTRVHRIKKELVTHRKHSKYVKACFGLGETISGVVSGLFKGLKGIGQPEPVTITWYTGEDLKNPSCWAKGSWAPTDDSFTCATTLYGWEKKPRCFKFIELCNGPKKCIFVRVVDSCAGCSPGSKHIDLTRAAFGELADLDKGILTVQLRTATEPDNWFEDLWGPKRK